MCFIISVCVCILVRVESCYVYVKSYTYECLIVKPFGQTCSTYSDCRPSLFTGDNNRVTQLAMRIDNSHAHVGAYMYILTLVVPLC